MLLGPGPPWVNQDADSAPHRFELVHFEQPTELIEATQGLAFSVLVVQDEFWTAEFAAERKPLTPRPSVIVVGPAESAIDSVRRGADYFLESDVSSAVATATITAAAVAYEERVMDAARRLVVFHSSDTVEITDATGRIEYVNPEFLRVTLYSETEVLGKTPAQLLRSGSHEQAFYDAIWKTVSRGRTWSGALNGGRKDGSTFYEVATISPLMDAGGELRKIVAVKRPVPLMSDAPSLGEFDSDMSRAIRVVLSGLVASESHFRTLVDTAGDAITVNDFESGRFVDVNKAACELFGYSRDEFLRLTARALSPQDEEIVVSAISEELSTTGHALQPRLKMLHRNGNEFWVTVRMSSFLAGDRRLDCAILRDVTEEVEREVEVLRTNEQLKQAQRHFETTARLAALGQLAAGVAHEVNNPLQFIQSNLSAVAQYWADGAPAVVDGMFQDIKLGVDRIESVIQALLPFVRAGSDDASDVDLNAVVKFSVRMADNELRHRARVILELDPMPPLVDHREKLGRVITNLLLNAAQAIEEGAADENVVTVSTRYVDGCLLVRVKDTGSGIEPEHMGNLFEPFFTTKGAGKGTGLGLSLCFDIARAHAGRIDVSTELGTGSQFTLVLPVDNGFALPSQVAEAEPSSSERLRILVIDDEPLVLRSYERMLGRRHEVVTALGGDRALERLDLDCEFDVILCDLMMPSRDGVMVYERLRASHETLIDRIVFCTGGVFTERVLRFLKGIQNRVLQKPISPQMLLEAVERTASGSCSGSVRGLDQRILAD